MVFSLAADSTLIRIDTTGYKNSNSTDESKKDEKPPVSFPVKPFYAPAEPASSPENGVAEDEGVTAAAGYDIDYEDFYSGITLPALAPVNKQNTAKAVTASEENTEKSTITTTVPETETGEPQTGAVTQTHEFIPKLSDSSASASSISLPVSINKIKPIISTEVQKAQTVSELDIHYYSITAVSRGYFELTFTHEKMTTGLSPQWKIQLLEQYNTEGEGGETKYRELTYLNASLDEKPVSSNRVGVYQGKFLIIVTPVSGFSNETYTLTASFTSANDYEAEPNDNLNRYNEIYPELPLNGSSSLLSSGEDKDYFMFEQKVNGYAELSFSHEDLKTISVGWLVNIIDAQGNCYYNGKSTLGTKELLSGAVGLKKGYYFIEIISNVNSPALYTLKLSSTVKSNFELEHNDTPATATILPQSVTISGAITPRTGTIDRDYYKINMPVRGVLSVSFSHPKFVEDNKGWNITVLDSELKTIYSVLSYWNIETTTVPSLGLSAGTYYICIDSENISINSAIYSLNVNYSTSTSWETEKNNTKETATPIVPGTSIYGALINDKLNFDTDYYTFTLTAPTTLSLRFEHVDLNADYEGWEITLLDSSMKTLQYAVSYWSDTYITTKKITLGPGTYYIKVDTGLWFHTEKYILNVAVG